MAKESFETYRPLLFSIAYRMLGSAMDAEDIVQEAYLRYQKMPPDSIESPKAFLGTMVTRLCLNQLDSARARREGYIGPWLPEPVLTGPDALASSPASLLHQRESISIAFLVLLENLTPAERTVFLLREVFDYPYAEIAPIVGKTESTCRQLFSRAKRHIAAHRPRFETSPEEHARILGGFMRAVEGGELEPLTDILAEDVTLWADSDGKIRGAITRPIFGRDAVIRFMGGIRHFAPEGAVVEMPEVNGGPAAILRYASGAPFVVVTCTVNDGHIQALHIVGNPDKLKLV